VPPSHAVTSSGTAHRRRLRQRWRDWRRSRPFWGGLLVALGGAEILLSVRAPLPVILHIGPQGLAGYLVPLILLICGVLLLANPHQRLFYAVVSILLALVSWLTSNLGGFLVGMLLALIGGCLAFAWSPIRQRRAADTPAPAPEPAPDGSVVGPEEPHGPAADPESDGPAAGPAAGTPQTPPVARPESPPTTGRESQSQPAVGPTTGRESQSESQPAVGPAIGAESLPAVGPVAGAESRPAVGPVAGRSGIPPVAGPDSTAEPGPDPSTTGARPTTYGRARVSGAGD
jgi:hypothetical protein